MNIYACLCMFIHIYVYSCMTNFLPGKKLSDCWHRGGPKTVKEKQIARCDMIV